MAVGASTAGAAGTGITITIDAQRNATIEARRAAATPGSFLNC